MAWLEVHEYSVKGWSAGVDSSEHARHYCEELERGAILFFPEPPFELPDDRRKFLLSLKLAGSRLHKNVSYRPTTDVLRGLDDRGSGAQLHDVMRGYAAEVRQFICSFLTPYAGKLQVDYASFRPTEEAGRNLPLHKRNDLLHVDAFPSRPTRGGRILRAFTNVNPEQARVWVVGERFPKLAERFARKASLERFASESKMMRALKTGIGQLGLVPDRAPYDRFMLHFHDWLKENAEFQKQAEGKELLEFPPMATWLVFTDGVPHAALSGQFAMEQTFIIPLEALVAPEVAPIRVLERLSRQGMG
jgi:3-deoxy-D-manno-oct-2-ulosonic acid (Kdo) hydroxylase